MNGILPAIFEAVALLAVVLIAWTLGALLRRPAGQAAGGAEPSDASARRLLGALATPAAVIALSYWLFQWLCASATVAARLPPEAPRHVRAWLLFWCVVLATRLVEGLAGWYYGSRGRGIPVPDLLRAILRAGIFVAAAFAILNKTLGKDITPLLTSTALLTAVIGFALQGVLGNLLAGMSLHIVRSVVPLDWVAIDKVEGQVVETNWRETRLRTLAGHIMIVPNSKVAEAVLHNMSRPTPRRRHNIEVGASYSDAPAEVIQALVESALSVPQVLREPAPSAYIAEYKDFGINYRLRFWSEVYFDRTPIEGDVNRMIWYKFKRRGIEIPFPMSDKLLCDFMEVVYRQRGLPPTDTETERRLDDLMQSEFATRVLVDGAGKPLVTRAELQSVATALRHVQYTAGETVFRQGDEGDGCYVVVKGQVKGQIEHAGVAAPTRFDLGRGAVLGEMSLMTGLPRTATITVTEEVELLEIPAAAFTQLLGLRPEIPEILARLAAERAAANAASLEELKTRTSVDVNATVRRESILKRFLSMLGGRTDKGEKKA